MHLKETEAMTAQSTDLWEQQDFCWFSGCLSQALIPAGHLIRHGVLFLALGLVS